MSLDLPLRRWLRVRHDPHGRSPVRQRLDAEHARALEEAVGPVGIGGNLFGHQFELGQHRIDIGLRIDGDVDERPRPSLALVSGSA